MTLKKFYNEYKGHNKVKDTQKLLEDKIENLNENGFNNLYLPIHPSYYVAKFQPKFCGFFDSKMVPLKICSKPSESKDDSEDSNKKSLKVIYKFGRFLLI